MLFWFWRCNFQENVYTILERQKKIHSISQSITIGHNKNIVAYINCDLIWSLFVYWSQSSHIFCDIEYTAVSVAGSIVEFLQWKMVFKSPNFYLECKRLQIFFCLVQNCPVVIWVACIGFRGSSRGSLRSERGFSEAFWTFSLVSLVKYVFINLLKLAWYYVNFLKVLPALWFYFLTEGDFKVYYLEFVSYNFVLPHSRII